MVHVMARDPWLARRVAWLVAALALPGCPPTVRPPKPPPEPTPVARMEPPGRVAPHGRQVLVGELCPQGAAGRPAIWPLMMRTISWSDTAGDLANAVERGAVPRFAVYGIDGKVAGVFDTIGLADVGLAQSVASGTYVGSGACTADAGAQPRKDDAACVAATQGCGLAVGELTRPDDPPETPVLPALAAVLDGVRAPAAEWIASPAMKSSCTPRFSLYGVPLTPEPERGKAADPKATVAMDVLGVIDLDGDGRKDLVLAFHFATVRTVVVFTASETAQRLELAGESPSFPR
jgi:hypothetical protein